MNSEFAAYVQLGFQHIVSPDALDHLLFLVALAAAYRGRDWRPALAVVSAFTVGHSVTLALAVTHVLVLPSKLIEFLIPVTIVVTAVENLWGRNQTNLGRQQWHRPALAALFGLVHGAGFAGYLESLMMTHIAAPLFGFNVGIEIGQIVVLTIVGVLFAGMDALLTSLRRGGSGFAWRVAGVSTAVLLIAGRLAWERLP